MPKNIKKVKVGNAWKTVVTGNKHRIGNRKNGKSANLMSSSALELVTGKDRAKARNVLANRV